jgi:hypothetical protein
MPSSFPYSPFLLMKEMFLKKLLHLFVFLALQQPTMQQQHPLACLLACLHFALFCCLLKVVCVMLLFPSLFSSYLKKINKPGQQVA